MAGHDEATLPASPRAAVDGMVDGRGPREALGEFLRRKRSAVRPEQVGLPAGSGRRVPGLRREETAIVAGISPDHYQRIEQGRVNASARVLDALAAALFLDEVERDHLHDLAASPAEPLPRSAQPDSTAVADFQRLVDRFDGPAFVLNHCRDVLAWNALGARLVTDFGALPPPDRNMVWLLLTDPQLRTLYSDWEAGARAQVAVLRRASARHPRDPRIHEIVERLTTRSEEFARWWPLHEVREKPAGAKSLDHPEAGTFTLALQALVPASRPDVEIFAYFPTDRRGAEALERLRS